jgi:hypothetical protein
MPTSSGHHVNHEEDVAFFFLLRVAGFLCVADAAGLIFRAYRFALATMTKR